MKKLLALLTAVALCMGLLAGVAMAEDENLASAKGLLDFMYKSKSRDKLTVTAEDYTVINQLMIDGVVYPVTWAVDLDTIQVSLPRTASTPSCWTRPTPRKPPIP